MCDIPSIAVFCSESIECIVCYGMASKFLFKLCYYSGGCNYYWYNLTFQVPHPLYLYTLTLAFKFLFCLLLGDISVRWYCVIYRYAYFNFFIFNYYVCLICHNFFFCAHPLIPQYCHTFIFTYRLGRVCVCVCVCRCVCVCVSYFCRFDD